MYFDIILYHGTTIDAAIKIINEKHFIPSTSGNLGPGVYFTDDKDTAAKIGKHRSKRKGLPGCVVFKCRVKAYERYCQKSNHEEWPGVCDPFIVFCLYPK